jgi:hypothetical protein
MLPELTNIASECLKRPNSASVWSPQLKKYVCEDTKEGRIAIEAHPHQTQPVPPPINRTFKFAFLWSFGGTLFFVTLCIGLSLAAGREPPPLFEKIIMSTFDLAKIGFGAVVGLLGGKYLQGEVPAQHPSQ